MIRKESVHDCSKVLKFLLVSRHDSVKVVFGETKVRCANCYEQYSRSVDGGDIADNNDDDDRRHSTLVTTHAPRNAPRSAAATHTA